MAVISLTSNVINIFILLYFIFEGGIGPTETKNKNPSLIFFFTG